MSQEQWENILKIGKFKLRYQLIIPHPVKYTSIMKAKYFFRYAKVEVIHHQQIFSTRYIKTVTAKNYYMKYKYSL